MEPEKTIKENPSNKYEAFAFSATKKQQEQLRAKAQKKGINVSLLIRQALIKARIISAQ